MIEYYFFSFKFPIQTTSNVVYKSMDSIEITSSTSLKNDTYLRHEIINIDYHELKIFSESASSIKRLVYSNSVLVLSAYHFDYSVAPSVRKHDNF